MYRPDYTDPYADPMAMYQQAMLARGGRARRFDEYYRCYPVAMMPGPERDAANHGGKVFLPASALDKLTTLHITYPMLFELINGAQGLKSHSGVLEFTAEEGRCYLPYWLMQTLSLDPGDLLQLKSTDLPPGNFIKLQPQSSAFLDISDPKAVLETAFRNFSCLTLNDIFTFSYNDTTYSIKVLELKPDNGESHAISVQETDLSVDFAEPVGYKEEMERRKAESGTSTPRSIGSRMGGLGGTMHAQGTMAQAINYASIAPSSGEAAQGAKNASSAFISSGHRLVPKKGKGSTTASPKPGTPVQGTSTNTPSGETTVGLPTTGGKTQKRRNGPQPLRLPPGKLFFGYEIKPVKDKEAKEGEDEPKKQHFEGAGQTLRKKK